MQQNIADMLMLYLSRIAGQFFICGRASSKRYSGQIQRIGFLGFDIILQICKT